MYIKWCITTNSLVVIIIITNNDYLFFVLLFVVFNCWCLLENTKQVKVGHWNFLIFWVILFVLFFICRWFSLWVRYKVAFYIADWWWFLFKTLLLRGLRDKIFVFIVLIFSLMLIVFFKLLYLNLRNVINSILQIYLFNFLLSDSECFLQSNSLLLINVRFWL